MDLRRLILKTTIFLGLAFPGLPAVAGTANTGYGALGYSYWTLGDWHPGAWSVRGGYYFTPWLAGEMQFLGRGNNDSGRFVDSGVGAYLRAEVPMGRRMRLYALAGYAYTDVIVAAGAKLTYDHSAYGFGAQVALRKKTSLAIDYISYNGDARVSAITASLGRSF
jgi:hypothetical protein